MWNTDSSLASLVMQDQKLWERKLVRLQQLGCFETTKPRLNLFREHLALGAIGRMYADLGGLGVPSAGRAF